MNRTSRNLLWVVLAATSAMPWAVYAESEKDTKSASYTVVKGDALWAIAKRNGVSLAALEEANPQIKNPDRIFPGDRVAIPTAGTPVTGVKSPPSTGGVKSPPVTGGVKPPGTGGIKSPVTTAVKSPLPKTPPFVPSGTYARGGLGGVLGALGDTVSAVGVRAIEAILSGTLRNPNTPNNPNNWGKWCRALVREAFKRATGRNLPELSAGGTAWDSYKAFEREGLIQKGGTPPRGAIVFWSPQERERMAPGSPGGKAGHIAISNGDGTVISNARGGVNPAIKMSAFGSIAGYVVLK